MNEQAVLLIGPYSGSGPDKKPGKLSEQTFIAPPFGLYRIAAYLRTNGIKNVQVWDPSLFRNPETELVALLACHRFFLIGISITHFTLENDLGLAHLIHQYDPRITLVAGGVEATFLQSRLFDLAPFDVVVIGEGEKPMEGLVTASFVGNTTDDRGRYSHIPGLWIRSGDQIDFTGFNPPMDQDEFVQVLTGVEFDEIPYRSYWNLLEKRMIGHTRAGSEWERERLQEIRSIRLITLNYCPYGCSFCVSTNFLDVASGLEGKRRARVVMLSAKDVVSIICKIASSYPDVQSIIFQEDNFTISEMRAQEVCERIERLKESGGLPQHLEFVCQSSANNLTPELLRFMKRAGFRLVCYGIESFSDGVLKELEKPVSAIQNMQTLDWTLSADIKAFANIILCTPKSKISDVFYTLEICLQYIERGVEIGVYSHVVPFPGAKITVDPDLQDLTDYETVRIPNTKVQFQKAVRIRPRDELVNVLVERVLQESTSIGTDFLQAARVSRISPLANSAAKLYAIYKVALDLPLPLEYKTQARQNMSRLSELFGSGPPMRRGP